jgi:hypothetical protein
MSALTRELAKMVLNLRAKKELGMKRNTAIVALAAWLLAVPLSAQHGQAEFQLKQNGFSANMQRAINRPSEAYQQTKDAPEYYGQNQALPPITAPQGSSGTSQQMNLPPITGNVQTGNGSGLSSQYAAPVQRPRPMCRALSYDFLE